VARADRGASARSVDGARRMIRAARERLDDAAGARAPPLATMSV